MGTVDVYRITDKLDDPTLDVLVARLEARGKHPRFIGMMQEYLGAMGIDSLQLRRDAELSPACNLPDVVDRSIT